MKLHQVLLVAGVVFLAGCAEPASVTNEFDPPGANERPPAADSGDSELHLRGHVYGPALVPIAGAHVSVVAADLAVTTMADGAFDFGRVPNRIHTLLATAPGFLDTSMTVTPQDAAQTIRFVLEPADPRVPYNTTVHFRGLLECAFEALIISPSCDSVITEIGGPALFDTNQSYLFSAEGGWKTLIVDVVFDGDAHPGLDGLRIAVRGSIDPDGGGEYAQYGRWHESHSFAARLEPNGSYPDGTELVPGNATGFQVDVYPHSHSYHPAEQGFLGVGVAQNVGFDVYATLFYVEAAPEDWSFLGASA